jgi:hypothetical protein
MTEAQGGTRQTVSPPPRPRAHTAACSNPPRPDDPTNGPEPAWRFGRRRRQVRQRAASEITPSDQHDHARVNAAPWIPGCHLLGGFQPDSSLSLPRLSLNSLRRLYQPLIPKALSDSRPGAQQHEVPPTLLSPGTCGCHRGTARSHNDRGLITAGLPYSSATVRRRFGGFRRAPLRPRAAVCSTMWPIIQHHRPACSAAKPSGGSSPATVSGSACGRGTKD